ncbi:unnamed protein product [Rotaria socialis]|uniref:Ribosomal RNA small subunit methyltransferase H n=1 Tax=Rotaria socialis TaxID=392032 RepID=A0A817Y9I3_9BILA|nr:unnamed protein product [Rotaria socialis]CAF3394119.1 unnamed protein product [Rotaria socialis]CAF3556792.1 unnamed protein product [Rotaria socialis]CAF3576182.1 unnamed protein product [Rotaria socialis]CAF3766687.1 unnamed protein product [Rotaria socialis]
MKTPLHIPVLLDHVLKILCHTEKQIFLDLTFGAGGHTKGLLNCNGNSIAYVLDRDQNSIELAREMAKEYPNRLFPFHGQFSELKNIFKHKQNFFDGILLDAGTSTMQLNDAKRGFSFRHDGPLDMRMNTKSKSINAYDLVNRLDETALSRIIRLYGEDQRHRKIARCIYQWRSTFGSISTTTQLANVIKVGLGGSASDVDKLNRPIHPATKTFQALRIVVNDELNELYNGLEQAYTLLKPGGTLLCISFHSLEDRIIKRHFQGIVLHADNVSSNLDEKSLSVQAENQVRYHLQTKKITEADDNELDGNPKARSAKLRYGIKI